MTITTKSPTLFRRSAGTMIIIAAATTIGVGTSTSACKSTSSGPSGSGASLSTITPPTVFPSRTIDVTITGSGTSFSGQPTVDFRDPNVKVKGVVVKSPTSLTASIEITDSATLGPHDVVVVSDALTPPVTLLGGFTIVAPLKHERSGSVQPGGVVDFELTNVDKDNPFVGGAPVLVSGAAIIDYKEVSAMRVTGTALVDALAPTGPLVVRLTTRNAKGESIAFATHVEDPLAPKVTEPRAATALVSGTPSPPETLALPRQTKLYKVPVADDGQIFFLSFGAVGESLRSSNSTRIVGAMAPASGKFGEGAVFDTIFERTTSTRVAIGLAPKGDAFFAVHASDLTGAAGPGYGYTVRPTIAKGTSFSTKEPAAADSAAAPLATVSLDGPVFSNDGAIDGPGDADFIVFTAKKTGHVFVQAAPVLANGGGSTPINVSLFGNNVTTGNCSVYISGGTGTSVGVLDATANTTYCARVDTTTPLTTSYSIVLSPDL